MTRYLVLLLIYLVGIMVFTSTVLPTGTGGFNPYSLRVPLVFEDQYNSEWAEVKSRINSVPQGESLYLEWRGLGGRTDLADNFIEVLNRAANQGKHIIVRVSGASISMHANVVCFAPEYQWAAGDLVFHGVYTRDSNGNKQYMNYLTEYYIDRCISRGILTQKDKEIIINQHKKLTVHKDGTREVSNDWK